MVCLWAHHDSERNFINYFYITVCLQRAGEILPDKTSIEENNDDKFGQLMRNKTVHLLAFFLMVYIGVEVTIGGKIFINYMIVTSLITPKSGWIVTFLMLVRGGGPSSGYVSTGFFGGKYLLIHLLLYVENSP